MLHLARMCPWTSLRFQLAGASSAATHGMPFQEFYESVCSHLLSSLEIALQHRHIQRQQEQLNRLEVPDKVGPSVSESSALPGPSRGERRAPWQAASEAFQGLTKVPKGLEAR